jgi:hypothetical protein
MEPTGTPLCPSMRCEDGVLLLGVIQSDGRAAFLPAPLPVNAEFVHIARKGRAPERRFRFAGPCRETGCGSWTEGRCGIADTVVTHLNPAPDGPVPPCAIRKSCRWWAQSGARACHACRFVVTDLTPETRARP